jgi:hypothetical protein
MALATGTKLGTDEVLSQIGAGGTPPTKYDAKFQLANSCNRV